MHLIGNNVSWFSLRLIITKLLKEILCMLCENNAFEAWSCRLGPDCNTRIKLLLIGDYPNYQGKFFRFIQVVQRLDLYRRPHPDAARPGVHKSAFSCSVVYRFFWYFLSITKRPFWPLSQTFSWFDCPLLAFLFFPFISPFFSLSSLSSLFLFLIYILPPLIFLATWVPFF